MTLILSGTDGLSDVDGSAATPAIRGTDTNTGIFFPAADTIAFSEGGVESMRLDSSGNVGIGTSSALNGRLNVQAGTSSTGNSIYGTNTDGTYNPYIQIQHNGINGTKLLVSSSFGSTAGNLTLDPAAATIFQSAGTERARITSGGVFNVGTVGLNNSGTAANFRGSNRVVRVYGTTEGEGALMVDKDSATTTTAQIFIQFSVNAQNAGSGQINANGANAAAFGTFSDARLKENIEDLPAQLGNICSLRPVEFDYKAGGHQIGFIAQEMQNVYPDVVGEGGDGMLTITGWDKTTARLVKAIQEQQAIIQSLTARIEALEGK